MVFISCICLKAEEFLVKCNLKYFFLSLEIMCKLAYNDIQHFYYKGDIFYIVEYYNIFLFLFLNRGKIILISQCTFYNGVYVFTRIKL